MLHLITGSTREVKRTLFTELMTGVRHFKRRIFTTYDLIIMFIFSVFSLRKEWIVFQLNPKTDLNVWESNDMELTEFADALRNAVAERLRVTPDLLRQVATESPGAFRSVLSFFKTTCDLVNEQFRKLNPFAWETKTLKTLTHDCAHILDWNHSKQFEYLSLQRKDIMTTRVYTIGSEFGVDIPTHFLVVPNLFTYVWLLQYRDYQSYIPVGTLST